MSKTKEGVYQTPTQLGSYVGLSGLVVNLALREMGYQKENGKKWILTDKADATIAVQEGRGQIRWSFKIMPELIDFMDN